MITCNVPGANRLGSVGRPVDRDGVRLAEDGEVLVRRDNALASGYLFHDPDEARATFLDAGWMPMWMVAVIISRDILVSYLRIFSEQNGVTMGARQSGKIKAVFQGVVQIGTVALVLASGGSLAGIHATLVFSLLLVATVVTAWSGIDYTLGFLRTVDLRHMVANRG